MESAMEQRKLDDEVVTLLEEDAPVAHEGDSAWRLTYGRIISIRIDPSGTRYEIDPIWSWLVTRDKNGDFCGPVEQTTHRRIFMPYANDVIGVPATYFKRHEESGAVMRTVIAHFDESVRRLAGGTDEALKKRVRDERDGDVAGEVAERVDAE